MTRGIYGKTKKPLQPDCSGRSGDTTIIGHISNMIYRKAEAIIFVGQIVVAVMDLPEKDSDNRIILRSRLFCFRV